MFGHTVRVPLAVLQTDWKEADPPVNLLDYVNGFRQCLYTADKLAIAQSKMKKLHDHRAERCEFSPGDQGLALLPIVGSPFQAKFMDPYYIVNKLSEQNYIIATPDHRKVTQLCHVNLLKLYYSYAVSEATEPGVGGSQVQSSSALLVRAR